MKTFINRFKVYRSRKQELKIINNLIKATWNYSDYYKLNKDKTIEKLSELLKMIGGR